MNQMCTGICLLKCSFQERVLHIIWLKLMWMNDPITLLLTWLHSCLTSIYMLHLAPLNMLISLYVDSPTYRQKTCLGLLEVSYGTTKSSGFVPLEFLETKIVRVKYRANRCPLPWWIKCVCSATVMPHLCKTARACESTHLHLIWLARSVIPGTCEYCLSKAK